MFLKFCWSPLHYPCCRENVRVCSIGRELHDDGLRPGSIAHNHKRQDLPNYGCDWCSRSRSLCSTDCWRCCFDGSSLHQPIFCCSPPSPYDSPPPPTHPIQSSTSFSQEMFGLPMLRCPFSFPFSLFWLPKTEISVFQRPTLACQRRRFPSLWRIVCFLHPHVTNYICSHCMMCYKVRKKKCFPLFWYKEILVWFSQFIMTVVQK